MKRRGTVLIIVLVLIALAGATLARLLEENALELTLAAREADRIQLRTEAWSEIELALGVLAEVRNLDRGRLHSPEQGWGDPRAYLKLPARSGLQINYLWEIENGKLPLPDLGAGELKKLFQALGQETAAADNLADALLGWMRPGHRPEDDRADDLAYDLAPIPYRAPRRSLRNFDELKAIGVVREAFFDELGLPTPLYHGFKRCVSLYRFPSTQTNFVEPEVLQALDFSPEGIVRARQFRSGTVSRPTGTAPYFRSRAEALAQLGGGNAARVTSLIQLLRLTVTLREGRAVCSASVLIAVDPAARFPEAAADPTAEPPSSVATPSRSAPSTGSTPSAGLRYPFPLLEWSEMGSAPALAEKSLALAFNVTSGAPLPEIPPLEQPLNEIDVNVAPVLGTR